MVLSPQQIAFVCLFGCLALGVAYMTIYEIWAWHRKRSLISLPQLLIRIIGGLLLIFLLAKVLGGFLYMQPGQQTIRVLLNYWAECTLLGWLLIGIVFIDLRLMMRLRRQKKRDINAMAKHLIDTFRAEHSPQADTSQD